MTRLITAMALAMAVSASAETVSARVGMTRGFVPAQVTVRVGDTVEFVNDSSKVHTVTADPTLARATTSVVLPPGAAPFNSGDIRPGETFRHTFKVPGLYRYFCIPHERGGMIGEVVVTE